MPAAEIPPTTELGLDPEAQRVDQLAREILRENYLHFHLERLEVVEEENAVRVRALLTRPGTSDAKEIEGQGVGVVDAFFDGVMARFAGEYPSLKTIAVSDFKMESGFDDAQGRRSDALAVAKLRVRNSEGVEFEFLRKTPSVTRSAVRAALDALTFFINSERAYVQLQLALTDAKERRRSDLVEKYRSQMGILVHATSYSDVIEKLRKDAE
jgi:LeuA allosteric (dimerisation) domain